MRLGEQEFDALVERALERVPAPVRDLLTNLEIDVLPVPGREARGLGPDLLGLYSGPTRQEMLSPEALPLPPARIVLYQRNLEEACSDPRELEREVLTTLKHEIAHHLGISDEELHRIWPEGA